MPAEGSLDDLDRFALPDGTPVRLRGLIGADRQVLQDMYAAWSQVSRRGRFLAAPPRLTELTSITSLTPSTRWTTLRWCCWRRPAAPTKPRSASVG